jgi:hypothetical protein
MQCEEFEERINAVLDERRRPEWDAELSLHCDTCAECRKLADSYDHLLDGFYALTTSETSADLALRVLVDLQNERPSRRRLGRVAVAMATAAAVLVAIVPLVSNTGEKTVAKIDQARHVAQSSNAAQPPLTEFPLVPELLSMTNSAPGDPYAGLAKGTGQGLANVMLYVPGIGGGKGIMDVPATTTKKASWTQPVSEGLRPITTTVSETFDLLIESLPVSQLAARS